MKEKKEIQAGTGMGTDIIDLDKLDFEPVLIKYHGIEYEVKGYTLGAMNELFTLEKEYLTRGEGRDKLFESINKVTGIPISHIVDMKLSVWQELKNQLFLRCSFAKKKEISD